MRAHVVSGTGGTFLTGIYGGYFGAAQGVILLAVLRLAFGDDLQRLNAIKNALSSVANGVAAVLFIAAAEVAWGRRRAGRRGVDRGRRHRLRLRPQAARALAAADRDRRRHDRRRHPAGRLIAAAYPCSSISMQYHARTCMNLQLAHSSAPSAGRRSSTR